MISVKNNNVEDYRKNVGHFPKNFKCFYKNVSRFLVNVTSLFINPIQTDQIRWNVVDNLFLFLLSLYLIH